jgi:hypothetical protein
VDYRRLGWLTPWGAAGRLYGHYGLPDGDLGDLDAVVSPLGRVLSWLEPVLKVALTVRTWLTLNIIALVVQIGSDGLGEFLQTLYQGAAITMVVGPFGVLLAVSALAIAAGRGVRTTAIRQLTRPVLLALLTLFVSVGIFGLQLPGVRQALRGLIEPITEAANEFPLSMIAPLLGIWLLIFGVCALYLIHHHTFGGRGNSLLDPLVSIWLAWTVGAVEITMLRSEQPSFVTATVLSATLATLISIVELVVLHRSGTTFRRGPWAAAAAADLR